METIWGGVVSASVVNENVYGAASGLPATSVTWVPTVTVSALFPGSWFVGVNRSVRVAAS